MDIVAFAKDNWAVISQAPWVFVTLAVLFGTGGMILRRFMFNERIAILNGRLAERDEKIAAYKTKLDGATPDEAARRIDALESRLASMEPWTLSADQVQTLKEHLSKKPGQVRIVKDMASTDCARVYPQVIEAFSQSGWRVIGGGVLGLGNPPKQGIGLTSKNGDNLSDDEKAIIAAFVSAKVSFAHQRQQKMPGADFESSLPEVLFTTRAV